MIMNLEQIQKTANTVFDLRDHTNIKYCKEIADYIADKFGGSESERISTDNFMSLVVARFVTTHRLLEFMVSRFGNELQIIELGSGFTPHFLNLPSFIGKYVEVDFEDNLILKQEILNRLTDRNNVEFISGDITSREVWKKISAILNPRKPVLIFSEGVIAQYFTAEQKVNISKLIKPLLTVDGSCFIVDDTLRNHPELHLNSIIKEGMERIAIFSGSCVYNNQPSLFTNEVDNWKKLFDNDVYLIDYVRSKLEMDFVLEKFKLAVCVNDREGKFEQLLANQSKYNSNMRVWK